MKQRRIDISSTSSRIVHTLTTPIRNLAEVAFESFSSTYSVPNVDSTKDSFMFNGKLHKIQHGSYLMKDLSRLFHKYTGIYLRPNFATGRIWFTLRAGKPINFNVENSFAEVIGAEKKVIWVPDDKDLEYECPYKNNIVPFNRIFIHCSLVKGSLVNGKSSNIIYAFKPENVKPGEPLVEKITTPHYTEAHQQEEIWEFEISVTDENMKLLDFRGEVIDISFLLHIKET